VTSYTIEYRNIGAANWLVGGSGSSTSRALSSLTSGTNYEWRVRANCSSNTSTWATSTFSTTSTNTTCAGPNTFTVTRINDNFTLGWNAISNANTYQLRYRPVDSSSWTTINNLTTNSYAITATLQPSTTYEWQVLTQCTNGATSDWAISSRSFTTTATAACSTPSFSGSTTSNGNINLSWGSVSTATSYQIQYKIQGTNNWLTYSVNGTTFTPTEGLVANTTYDWQVRSICGSLFSDWRARTFTTSNSSGSTCTGTTIPVQNTITNGSYVASNNINATCIINSGGTVTMQAGNNILLAPGFHAKTGANFTATIAACNTMVNQEESIAMERSAQEIGIISTVPNNQTVLQIMPNPFREETTIRFYLPKESVVQISIINLNGQVVTKQSIQGSKGWSSTALNASQLPAGMYFTLLQTATQQLTKKIMVLR